LEEGLEFVEQVLAPKQLNKVQKIVLRGVWQEQSYKEISEEFDYTLGHIKDTGADLWKLLSAATKKKVTRHNFRGVLKWATISRSEPWAQPKFAIKSAGAVNIKLTQ
jgi:hypothetical protein